MTLLLPCGGWCSFSGAAGDSPRSHSALREPFICFEGLSCAKMLISSSNMQAAQYGNYTTVCIEVLFTKQIIVKHNLS